MKRLAYIVIAWILVAPPPAAWAQGVPNSAQVVSTCGTPPATYTPGQNKPLLQNSQGNACVNASVSIAGSVTANQGNPGASSWPINIDQTTPGSTNGVVVNSGTVTATIGPPAATTPAAGASSTIVTGGSATTVVSGTIHGCYVVNPLTATDQGIATPENATVNGVTTASTTGNGTNSALVPGQAWGCVPGQTTGVSAIAATSGHRLVVVKW